MARHYCRIPFRLNKRNYRILINYAVLISDIIDLRFPDKHLDGDWNPHSASHFYRNCKTSIKPMCNFLLTSVFLTSLAYHLIYSWLFDRYRAYLLCFSMSLEMMKKAIQ